MDPKEADGYKVDAAEAEAEAQAEEQAYADEWFRNVPVTYDHTDHAAESIDRMERMRGETRADYYPDSFADDEYE